MLKRLTLIMIFLLGCLSAHAQTNVIYDDDFWQDWDVATNMATLHKLADQGSINIIGMIVDSGFSQGVATAKVFNSYYLRPKMYVGAYQGNLNTSTSGTAWASSLASAYGVTDTRSNNPATGSAYPDCVTAYRTMLAAQANNSTVVVVTGAMSCLSGLLNSSADGISSLNGQALVKAKVTRLVFMGGDAGNPSHYEFNFAIDAASAANVFNTWTSQNGFPPAYGIDFNAGNGVVVGPYAGKVSSVDPGAYVFAANSSTSRPCWDTVAILLAAIQFNSYRGFTFTDAGNGTITVNSSTGSVSYNTSGGSGQHYVTGSANGLIPFFDGSASPGFLGMAPGNSMAMAY